MSKTARTAAAAQPVARRSSARRPASMARTTVSSAPTRGLADAHRSSARSTSRLRWTELAGEDVFGIDADIERAVAMFQETHGCAREHARGELLRKLSNSVGMY